MLISAEEIIKSSWDLYKKNWKHFTAYMLLLILPSLLLLVFTGGLSAASMMYFSSNTTLIIVLQLIIAAAAVVYLLWISIAFAQVVRLRLQDNELPTFKAMLGSVSHLIWPVIIASILTSIIVFAGLLLFIIPGVIFMVWYAFTYYAVVFDGQTGMSALRASKALVVGRWWQIVWRLAAPSLLFVFIGWAIGFLLSLPLEIFFSERMGDIVFQIISSLINIVITPLTASASIILYFNAKENLINAPTNQPPA